MSRAHPAERVPRAAARPALRRAAGRRRGWPRTFELHGFANVETRAVEPLDQLLRKGETSKEVYVLRRIHDDREGDAGLGLHFDLTVPFARYVLENAGKLEFPFRRYQIQKVWRGERPQEGRFREFTQADIDVIGRDTLAFHHDVEVARVMLGGAGGRSDFLPGFRLQVNNRKLIQGFYAGLGADRHRRRDACGRQARQAPRGAGARAARRRGRAHRRAGRRAASRWPGSARPTPPSSSRSARSAYATSCSTRAWPSSPRSIEGCAPLVTDRVEIVRRPQDRPRARLLHRHRLRDPAARLRGRSARSAPAAATTRSPATAVRRTPASASPSASAGVLVPLLDKGVVVADRSVPSAVLVAVVDEDAPAESDAPRRAAARQRASPARSRQRRRSSASRSATPSAVASRTCSSPAADGRREPARGQGHPQRRPDRGRPRPPGRRRWRTSTRASGATNRSNSDPHPRRRQPAAEHVDTEVTLAGWVARRRDHGGVAFIDLREASGVVQVVIRDEAVAHHLRSEYCLKVTGTVSLRPEGNQNPDLPTGEVEVIATDVEVLSEAAPLPFPIDDARRACGRGGAAAPPLPRPAPQRPQRRAAPAQQGQQGRPRRARRRTPSSRSRPRP